jgi:hypothetical protein
MKQNKSKAPKYPLKPYSPAKPEKILKNKYITFDIKDKTLKDLLDFLPIDVNPIDVRFDAEVDIDYGYYNDATACVNRLYAFYYTTMENPNYDAQIVIYEAAIIKYKEDLKNYNKQLKIWKKFQAEQQLKAA